ncbi:MAG TPA: hypothetical protein VMZ90_04305 [Vicinamibacterales bacterium]|nr:hypothetical protein [Vicinamibacterales bacterium]
MSTSLRLSTFALFCVAAACSRGGPSVDVEKVPVGTQVAVTKEDGGVVTGKLTERDVKDVKVDVGRSVRSLPRKTISDVRVVPAETPVELPPVARFREYTIEEGTPIHVRLETTVDSGTSKVEDPVNGALTQALVVNGTTVAPVGSRVRGEVTAVQPSPKKGRASLAFQFRSLIIAGHDSPYSISAGINRVAPTEKKDDAITIGAPAVVGGVIGGIVGGKKGAVIGAVVGGGAGTAIVLTTEGKDISLPSGTEVTMTLKTPVDIRVPINKG